jgi:hypothetical protein
VKEKGTFSLTGRRNSSEVPTHQPSESLGGQVLQSHSGDQAVDSHVKEGEKSSGVVVSLTLEQAGED